MEGVFESLEYAIEEHGEMDKVINGNEFDSWWIVQQELAHPTTKDSGMIAVIQKVERPKHKEPEEIDDGSEYF